MLIWKDATQSKPKQGDRVLLKIANDNCPVVGCWGAGEWNGCDVHIDAESDAYCPHGANVIFTFSSEDVTHYAEIGDLPE